MPDHPDPTPAIAYHYQPFFLDMHATTLLGSGPWLIPHLKFEVLVLYTLHIASYCRLRDDRLSQVQPIESCCLPSIVQPDLRETASLRRQRLLQTRINSKEQDVESHLKVRRGHTMTILYSLLGKRYCISELKSCPIVAPSHSEQLLSVHSQYSWPCHGNAMLPDSLFTP